MRACAYVCVCGETETALNKRLRWFAIIDLLIICPVWRHAPPIILSFSQTHYHSFATRHRLVTMMLRILLHGSVIFITFVLSFGVTAPQWAGAFLILDVSRSHTTKQHSR